MGKKKAIQIFCIILMIQCFVIIVWGGQKERLNVDEMFTMEGAKQGGLSMRYWDLSDEFYGSEHTNEEFLEHMTVNPDELIIYQGLTKVAERLLHGEFYYVIVNLASTLWPGHIPWGPGVVVNLICFLITQVALFHIAKKFTGNICALCTTVVYGFSTGAISMVLYVRCYMMIAMYIVVLIYVYLKLIEVDKPWKKFLCMVCSELLAIMCYLTHQFGTILFVITALLFVIYILMIKEKNTLIWMIFGYCIPILLAYKTISIKAKAFFTNGLADIFYSSMRNISLERIIRYIVELLHVLAEHFFLNIWIMLLVLAGCICHFIATKKQCKMYVFKGKFIVAFLFMIVTVYYTILIVGGAIAWKYFCPVYPIVALLLSIGFCSLSFDLRLSVKKKAMLAMAGTCIVVISYNMGRVSELFQGEKRVREEMEKEYHGVNGIMVHHDSVGIGENRLYEAAMLWPEGSNVLVIQNKVLSEKKLCYNRVDDRILLWLTDDYDKEEAIGNFQECTDYETIELIKNWEHLWIYECNKQQEK